MKDQRLLDIRELETAIRQTFRRLPEEEGCRLTVCFNHIQAWNTETPLVEVDEGGYHYKFYERGNLRRDDVTRDLELLLYWVFQDIVFAAACAYELKHRIEGQDVRRLLFRKEIQLMGCLGAPYVARLEEHLRQVLVSAPFDDRPYWERG